MTGAPAALDAKTEAWDAVLGYRSALTYVLNLSRSDALSHVQLVRHEVKQNDPQRPVSFAISAAWNEVKK